MRKKVSFVNRWVHKKLKNSRDGAMVKVDVQFGDIEVNLTP